MKRKEVLILWDSIVMQEKKECIRCGESFWYKPEQDCHWDFMGVTPTKIVKCSCCQCLQAVAYIRESNVNLDKRYYAYA